MNGPDPSGYAPDWLALREPADAEARSAELAAVVRDRLAARAPGPLLVRDLGAGTGAMARWLAGRLPGPQHWVLYDRDPALLARAAAAAPPQADGGAAVGVEVREADLAALGAPDLAGAGLVTASALLDLLTGEEVAGLAGACAGAGCAALITLSVAGRVELDPADPLDAEVRAAFNAHQRRAVGGRRPLGPDAPGAAARAFRERGAEVLLRPSPWRLGPDRPELLRTWLHGWVAAAVEQTPGLAVAAAPYLARRTAQSESGLLHAAVHHTDLLALPPEPP
ncbi:hypothetical protein [Nocardiopsis potens]|uniref:hypothetical protein n=1 Tax=Nocardiopsis potens TaxID=1246458 RepID=UPI0003495A33|nr:hypothetical protein [Nocardiopsis potens]